VSQKRASIEAMFLLSCLFVNVVMLLLVRFKHIKQLKISFNFVNANSIKTTIMCLTERSANEGDVPVVLPVCGDDVARPGGGGLSVRGRDGGAGHSLHRTILPLLLQVCSHILPWLFYFDIYTDLMHCFITLQVLT